ncbi:MAG: MFS transporter [Candidatus Bathyarchaeia archaeon]
MSFKLLYLGLMINSIGIGMLVFVLPLYINYLKFDSIILGIIISSEAVAYIVASPIWGRISDTLGRKLALVSGMSGYALVVLLFSFANNPLQMLSLRLLQGFTDASYWTVPAALAVDMCKSDETGKTLGNMGTFQGIGLIAGPLIGGVVTREFNYPILFCLCSALTFFSVFIIIFGVRVKKIPSRGIKVSSKFWPNFDVKAKKSFGVAYLGSLISSIFFGIVISNFIVHASEILVSTLLAGVLLCSYFVAESFIQPLAGRLCDIIGKRPAIFLAFITCGLGFFILIFSSSFVYFLIAITVIGAGVGQLYITSIIALMDLAPTTARGLVSGLQNFAWGLGYFIGPIIGGILALHSFEAPYVFCTFAAVFGSMLTILCYAHE